MGEWMGGCAEFPPLSPFLPIAFCRERLSRHAEWRSGMWSVSCPSGERGVSPTLLTVVPFAFPPLTPRPPPVRTPTLRLTRSLHVTWARQFETGFSCFVCGGCWCSICCFAAFDLVVTSLLWCWR